MTSEQAAVSAFAKNPDYDYAEVTRTFMLVDDTHTREVWCVTLWRSAKDRGIVGGQGIIQSHFDRGEFAGAWA